MSKSTARIVVIDSTTSQSKADKGVLPGSRFRGRTSSAYQSSARRATGRDNRRASKRSGDGTEHDAGNESKRSKLRPRPIPRSSERPRGARGKSWRGESRNRGRRSWWKEKWRPEVWNSGQSRCVVPSYTRLQRFRRLRLSSAIFNLLLRLRQSQLLKLVLFCAMEWDPSCFFRPEGSPSPYALLILNQPINEKAFGVLSEHGESPLEEDWGFCYQPQISYMHIPVDQALTGKSANDSISTQLLTSFAPMAGLTVCTT